MYLDDEAPIAGGREIWGFPKKLAAPAIVHESDVIRGTLHYGSALCASGSVGYKHEILDPAPVLDGMRRPNFMLKIIPHVDGRSEEHTSELQSLMRTSYAVFCLKKTREYTSIQ